MDILKNESRVSLHGQMATVFLCGDLHATLVYDDGHTAVQPKASLYNALGSNSMYFVSDDEVQDPFDETLLDKKIQAKLNRVRDYVNDLRKLPSNRSRKVIAQSIKKTAKRIGDEGNEPSVSAVYDWLRAADRLGPNVDPGQIMMGSKDKEPDRRIPEHMDNMMRDVIDDVYYLSNVSIKHAYNVFCALYEEKYKIDLGESKIKTFYRRVNARCPIEKAHHRIGPQKAKEMRRAVLNDLRVNTIMDQYQVDAVHLMIGLKDDEENFIGYPVVHFCIDVYSRAIVGFSVELNGESSAGVIECLKHTFNYKNRLTDHPYTQNEWIMYGKPFEIGSDGGSAYMAVTVSGFLRALNVTRQAAQTRTAWHKGVVERFNGTCRKRFAEHMKGYLGKKEYAREVDGNLKEHTHHTLESFKQELTRYIVDDYNQAPHSHHSGRSPHNVWKEMAIHRQPEVPAELPYANKFRGNWLKATFSHPNGLRVKNVSYNSRGLTKLYWQMKRDTDGPVKMLVLHNPLDISEVTVLDDKKLYVVPAVRSDVKICVGMPLAEYDAKRKAAAQKAQEENAATNAHVDYGQLVYTETKDGPAESASEERPAKPKRKNKRPQAPLGDIDNTSRAVELASKQGLDTNVSRPGPIEAGTDDEIDSDPFANISFGPKGGANND